VTLPPSLFEAIQGLPSPGEVVVGKYLVERYLAHGGMGVVAAGRHVELDEPVALKFLRPDLLSGPGAQDLSARFLREARATIKIRSEHVPRILDVTTTATGVPLMVMELLEGDDLDTHLERHGPMPVVFAVEVMLQAIEGLAAAHALGMVHRDFKPANVFLSRRLDGTLGVKVLDFGIAKLIDAGLVSGADGGMTATNTTMGSPRYMAPEQMRSARDLDARADIWAIGVTVYEMLTRRAPFDGDSVPAICVSILQDAPRPISFYRPDVPKELVAAIERCLCKAPEQRFGNVADIAEAIASFGPQPSSNESAARVRRLVAVVGGPRAGSSDRFPVTAPVSAATAAVTSLDPVPPVPSVTVRLPSGDTAGSWTGAAPGAPSREGRTVRLVAVAATLCLLLGVAVSAAFVVVRAKGKTAPDPSPAAAAVLPGGASAAVSSSAPPAPPAPPASSAVESPSAGQAQPASTLPPRAPLGARAASLPRGSATTAAPLPPSPTPNPPAKPSGGLWDDRK
jgi:serine/threonine-protein kinase